MSGTMALQLALLLTLLSQRCSSLHLPVPSLANRDLLNKYPAGCTLPDSPESSDEQSPFIDLLKTSFAYDRARSEVDPINLNWNVRLEAAAKIASSTCSLTYTIPNVTIARYEHQKDDGVTSDVRPPDALTDAAIEYWRDWQSETAALHDARDDYHALTNPNVDSFGCAWSDWNACDSYILHCFFSNATCHQEGSNSAMKRSESLATVSSPDPSINTLAGDFFASVRADQGLPANSSIVLQECPSLGAQTLEHAMQCNASKAITVASNEIWSETTLSSIPDQRDPWHQIMLDAEMKWYLQRTAGTPSTPLADSEYATMVDPQATYYSCSWAHCHPGQDDESVQIFCAFTDTSTAIANRLQPSGLALRAEQFVNISAAAVPLFSAFRRAGKLPSNETDLVWSWIEEGRALVDSLQCNGVVTEPATELYYEILASTMKDTTNWEGELLLQATTAWAESGDTTSDDAAASGYQRAYDVILNPTWKSVGCFTTICNQTTKDRSFVLYCRFSKDIPGRVGRRDSNSDSTTYPSPTTPDISDLRVRDQETVPTMDPSLAVATFTPYWDQMRDVSNRIRSLWNAAGIPSTVPIPVHAKALDLYADKYAQACNGNRVAPYNMAVFKVIVSTSFLGPGVPQGTKMAFDQWQAQKKCDVAKNPDCNADYRKIMNTKNKWFGAGWSFSNDNGVSLNEQFPCGLLPNEGGSAYGETYFYVVFSGGS